MKKTLLLIVVAAIGFARCAQQQTTTKVAEAEPKIEINVNPDQIISITYDDNLLREAKAAYQANDPEFMKLFNIYRQSVERNSMNAPLVSITDGIIHLPPTGDPRDYITLSPYWWPDPDTEDGLPYIRSDGVRNPEVNDYPGRTLSASSHASGLSFLYYITGEEKYAEKAAALIRNCYLDPEKGMNPNVVFAQYVPGMQRIRGTGLLEVGSSIGILNSAKMIEPSQAWTDEDEEAMQDWATAFLYWIEYSTHGQEEHKGGNNHAMWYESNRQAVALYTKEYEHLADIIVKYQFPRLSEQIAADSTMPHEVARTLGLHYTTFVLSSVARTSIIAEKIGMNNIWTHVGPNGRGMLWGLDFIIPYWLAPDTWPHMQITPARESSIPLILSEAYKGTGIERYNELKEQIGFTGIAGSSGPRSATAPGGTAPRVDINSILFYKLKR